MFLSEAWGRWVSAPSVSPHFLSQYQLPQFAGETDIVANVTVFNVSMNNAENGARIKVFGGNPNPSTYLRSDSLARVLKFKRPQTALQGVVLGLSRTSPTLTSKVRFDRLHRLYPLVSTAAQ